MIKYYCICFIFVNGKIKKKVKKYRHISVTVKIGGKLYLRNGFILADFIPVVKRDFRQVELITD